MRLAACGQEWLGAIGRARVGRPTGAKRLGGWPPRPARSGSGGRHDRRDARGNHRRSRGHLPLNPPKTGLFEPARRRRSQPQAAKPRRPAAPNVAPSPS
jgi:hypothetical protein